MTDTANTTGRKTFPVYSQKLAGFLMMQGFILVNIAPNERCISKNVFFFWDSPQIQKEIKNYLDKR